MWAKRAYVIRWAKIFRPGVRYGRGYTGADQYRINAKSISPADIGLQLVADHDHILCTAALEGLFKYGLMGLAEPVKAQIRTIGVTQL